MKRVTTFLASLVPKRVPYEVACDFCWGLGQVRAVVGSRFGIPQQEHLVACPTCNGLCTVTRYRWTTLATKRAAEAT